MGGLSGGEGRLGCGQGLGCRLPPLFGRGGRLACGCNIRGEARGAGDPPATAGCAALRGGIGGGLSCLGISRRAARCGEGDLRAVLRKLLRVGCRLGACGADPVAEPEVGSRSVPQSIEREGLFARVCCNRASQHGAVGVVVEVAEPFILGGSDCAKRWRGGLSTDESARRACRVRDVRRLASDGEILAQGRNVGRVAPIQPSHGIPHRIHDRGDRRGRVVQAEHVLALDLARGIAQGFGLALARRPEAHVVVVVAAALRSGRAGILARGNEHAHFGRRAITFDVDLAGHGVRRDAHPCRRARGLLCVSRAVMINSLMGGSKM